MNVLVILKTGTAIAAAFVTPLTRLSGVETVHVVREAKVSVESAKLRWHEFGRAGVILSLAKMFRTGMSVLRSNDIDFVVTFNPMPYGAVAWILAKLWKKPISMGLIGDDYYVHCKAWYGFVLRFLLRHSDFVTVTGEKMIRGLVSLGVKSDTNRVLVLPHSVDVDRFAHMVPLSKREFDFMCIGDLIPRKRFHDIIRAFSKVQAHFPGSRLAIIGDGPLMESLQRCAKEVGVESNTTFFGRQENLEKHYNSTRILLVASEREGLPFVLVEGMCCGCVPISTDCGTISELINDGKNGFLIDIGDWNSMGDLCIELMSKPDQLDFLSKQARMIRAEFNWDVATKLWDNILFANTQLRN